MPPAQWGPLDANISMLFTELPVLGRPAAAAAAGFTAVEAWWPFAAAVPGDAEVTAFERAVRDAGVQLVALNGFAGDMPAGERGILSWPGRRGRRSGRVRPSCWSRSARCRGTRCTRPLTC